VRAGFDESEELLEEQLKRSVSGAVFGEHAQAFAGDLALKLLCFGALQRVSYKRIVGGLLLGPGPYNLLYIVFGNLQRQEVFAVTKVYFHINNQTANFISTTRQSTFPALDSIIQTLTPSLKQNRHRAPAYED